MKNIYHVFFVVIILIISVFSCKEQVVKTKSQSFEQKIYLVPTDTARGELNVKVELEFPATYTSSAVLDSIHNTLVINMFGKEYVNIPFDSIPQIYAAAVIADYNKMSLSDLQEFEKKVPNFSLGTFYHYIEGFPLLNDGRIFSYGYTRDVYIGGAQGLKTYNYFNFDLKNGHLLDENDIFINNYQNALAEIIKNTILDHNADVQYPDTIMPNGNFYISDEGITYLYNVYEIAPYYVTQTEVFLPYSQLKGILRKDNPINYLVMAAK
ncbi:MAG: RsiV family protein [Paludibacter sp.]|nr:RsiV family protein [Paludibacter sp.]